ncbi:MAG TPA: ABC transporter substrate-binding protein [Kineosporiaceae bacterium]|nr:ABC transporter substrate-binding protein [Kineosporiaceae bacterium]
MTSSISRRQALAAVLGTAALSSSIAGTTAAAGASGRVGGARPREETRTLDELYRDALAEGGKLVIYSGGDIDSQADGVRAGFRSEFPDIDLRIVVDYSKFHDARVDNQIATDTLVPDLVQLQTLHDFPRWKQEGRLLAYKPAGFSHIYDGFKDPDGAWVAIAVLAFSYMYSSALAGKNAPRMPTELVDPRWKGQIASSYPNDDDAVLYLFKLYAETYGWDWIAKLAGQELQFARGSFTPRAAVTSGQKLVGIGGSGSLTAPPSDPVRWAAAARHPFMGWGQRAAIFADAKHPTAAKLYLNWQLSAARQQASTNGWSVRTDVTPAGGLAPIWKYSNAHLDGFARFMADRGEVERWKQTFTLYFGEVKGEPSAGWLGLRP